MSNSPTRSHTAEEIAAAHEDMQQAVRATQAEEAAEEAERNFTLVATGCNGKVSIPLFSGDALTMTVDDALDFALSVLNAASKARNEG